MTIETASGAMKRLWRGLERVRDRWLVLVFVGSTVFWVQDTVKAYVTLPNVLERQTASLAALEARILVLEFWVTQPPCFRAGCLRRPVGFGL